MDEAKRRKGLGFGKTSNSTIECEFGDDLFSVFTGKYPGLDKIAEKLDFTPEYAVSFVLNKKDTGILFFNKRKSNIAWIQKPTTVSPSVKTVLMVKDLFQKQINSVRCVIEYIGE